MGKQDESIHSNLWSMSMLVGILLYVIALQLLPPISSNQASAVFALCIVSTYVILKKKKQSELHKEGEVLSTSEERSKWKKRKEKGFLRFMFNHTVGFCLKTSLPVFAIVSLLMYFSGKQMEVKLIIEASAGLLGLFLVGGCGLGLLTWWDNQDNEREWLHHQSPQRP